MEKKVFDRFYDHFWDYKGTSVSTIPITEAVRFMGDTPVAQDILNGKYAPPEGTNPHRIAMLDLIE